MQIEFFDVNKSEPPKNIPILGWWPSNQHVTGFIESVVYSGSDCWHRLGYQHGEKRNPPAKWAVHPIYKFGED